eukprot:gnl/Spiro4/15802_TR8500_c0_g1_i1.p1 gnl/Spiro4/15802_TR8500_c0_g1~~gnl/Spiro4/15802_TR8500_c0_g1_i1.p1  ORF type:complete len:378 (+),score=-46.91 gnl/Spiro4/15802_TR8500_c0_g1_i1:157-1134(+)
MEESKSTEMTDEEIELMKSMELKKTEVKREKVSKNDFGLKMPNNFTFNAELDFMNFDVNSSSKKGEVTNDKINVSKYHKENNIPSTSVYQDLDFGFGDYDPKTMVKFEFESVVDSSPFDVIFQFDPKKVTHLDFEAGVLRNCEKCKKTIEMRDVISSFGKLYHKKCLNCFKCKKDFTNLVPKDGTDGNPYCESHWYDTFSEKCCKCSLPIREVVANAVGKKWHPHCFTCTTCDSVLDVKAYMHLKGTPYCDLHYYDELGMVCPICELPIKTEEFVDPKRGSKFHIDHYSCAFCRKKLQANELYKQIEKKPNKIYCAPCCLRIFGL